MKLMGLIVEIDKHHGLIQDNKNIQELKYQIT